MPARLWTPAHSHHNDPAAGTHAALISYEQTQQAIGRADTKAGLAVTAIGAAIGYLLTRPAPTSGRVLFLTGVTLLLLALTLAGAAVYPRLGGRAGRAARDGLYWGEIARSWTPDTLAGHLAGQDPAERLEALTRQLVTVAKVAVRKHRFLQASLLTSLTAVAVLTAAYLA